MVFSIRRICKFLDGMQDFFRDFGDNISVRRFDYGREVKGTVLEGDPYFGSEATVRAAIPAGKMASYSDLVRYILLHNYGGLWWVALLLIPKWPFARAHCILSSHTSLFRGHCSGLISPQALMKGG